MPTAAPPRPDAERDLAASARGAGLAALAGLVLVAVAAVVPSLLDFDPRVNAAPLHAEWDPRLLAGTAPAVAVGIFLLLWLPGAARTLAWRPLLAVTFGATWLWTTALAMTEGTAGYSRVFERPGEYVYDAQRVTDLAGLLPGFIERIPLDSVDNWNIHVAGHPPGALLFFVLLDRLGVTGLFWVGVVVVTIGSTAAVAYLVTVRALADEQLARTAVPWLALAPVAVWMGANGDAVFTAVSAWGLALLALATRGRRRWKATAVGAGLLLGLCVYLSYGLVLLGVLALAVLALGRSWRPLPWALGGALLVAALFTIGGFAWWEAYPVLVERYYDGIASDRAYSYWLWANLAAWTCTVGLAVWAAFPTAFRAARLGDVRARLAAAAGLTILLATLSGMSKAEVERIWMPFTLWILVLPALLPERWHRPLLATQVVTGLLAQHLLLTRW